MLPSLDEQLLDLQRPTMVRLDHVDVREGAQAVRPLPLALDRAGRVKQFERNGSADAYLAAAGKGGKCLGDHALGEARPDARVGEVASSRHLLVSAPGGVCGVEVEPARLAEEID